MSSTTADEFGSTKLSDSARAQVRDVTDKAHRTVDRAASATAPLIERAASSAQLGHRFGVGHRAAHGRYRRRDG